MNAPLSYLKAFRLMMYICFVSASQNLLNILPFVKFPTLVGPASKATNPNLLSQAPLQMGTREMTLPNRPAENLN